MLNKTQIENIIHESFDGTDKFLVECIIKPTNLIHVFIDGDHGVLISDCIKLSRLLEKTLNPDENDFELNVSSAGLDQGFKLLRQYIKNIGREVDVKLKSGQKLTGTLMSADDKNIEIMPPLKNKKSKTPIIPLHIALEDIQETKIKIIFKTSE